MEKTVFAFDAYEPRRGSHSVTVRSGTSSKTQLIGQLSKDLRFPRHFGFNWDSFEECVNDLSWIRENKVALIHEDIPLRTDGPNLAIYLSILAHAISRFEYKRKKTLIVLFQSKDRKALMDFMKDNNVVSLPAQGG